MHDDKRNDSGSGNRASDEASFSVRLRSLGARIGKTAGNRPTETPDSGVSSSDPSAMARGFRLSSEMVGGVIAGALIGYLLDHGLGISPWGMIVFVLLGFAAGVVNVIRAAGIGHDPSKRDTNQN
jgi:ATP synthase protein I